MEPPPSKSKLSEEQQEKLAEYWEAVLKLRAEPFLAQTVLVDRLPKAGQIPPVEKPVWFLLEQYQGRIPIRTTLDENALCKAYRKAVYYYDSYKYYITTGGAARNVPNKAQEPITFFGEIRSLFRGIRDMFALTTSIVTFFVPTSFFVFVALLLIGLVLAIGYFL